MNIHPAFVHFPIAFLTLYSLLDIFRFKKLTSQHWYFYTKAILVISGTLASYATYYTGTLAQKIYHGLTDIVGIHHDFALATIEVFTLISIFYVAGWLRRNNIKIWQWLEILERRITEGSLGITLAILGLALVTTTAALGGLLAYGPKNDPLSHYLYSLITKQ
jgi:uncharacterized membrane protein